MREMTWTPNDKSAFKGKVVLKIPKYRERIAILKEAGYSVGKDGVEAASDHYAFADKMIQIVEKNVLSVELTHEPSCQKFSSIDELEVYQEGTELINELGQTILGGVKLGNG